MGILWSFLNPLLMLAVYGFMFLFVFRARWGLGDGADPNIAFVPILFTGLIIHAFFAEIVTSAPTLILSNVNFVKKIVFPLEILSVVSVAAALFNCFVAWIVLAFMQTFLGGQLHLTLLLFPMVVLPLAVFGLGLSWTLASLGVFVRDVAQVSGFLATAALFLSPIFFPVDALPQGLRPWIHLNPLTLIVEDARKVMIFGEIPNVIYLAIYLAVASIFAATGFAIFQKMRKGFADVL